MRTKLIEFGDSLGVRLPKKALAKLGLAEGSLVNVLFKKGRIVVSKQRRVYTLDELLAGMTPQVMREAFDWGAEKGREYVC